MAEEDMKRFIRNQGIAQAETADLLAAGSIGTVNRFSDSVKEKSFREVKK